MSLRVLALILCFGFCLACKTANESLTKSNVVKPTPDKINADNIEELSFDSTTHELLVKVQVCPADRPQEFDIVMSKGCLESYPAQCSAEILAEGNYDNSCKSSARKAAIVKEDLRCFPYDYFYLSIKGKIIEIKHEPEDYNSPKCKVIEPIEPGDINSPDPVVEGVQLDDEQITSISYSKGTNKLKAVVTYDGGCSSEGDPARFELRLNDYCLESLPAQCTANVFQIGGLPDSEKENCEAALTATVELDLTCKSEYNNFILAIGQKSAHIDDQDLTKDCPKH